MRTVTAFQGYPGIHAAPFMRQNTTSIPLADFSQKPDSVHFGLRLRPVLAGLALALLTAGGTAGCGTTPTVPTVTAQACIAAVDSGQVIDNPTAGQRVSFVWAREDRGLDDLPLTIPATRIPAVWYNPATQEVESITYDRIEYATQGFEVGQIVDCHFIRTLAVDEPVTIGDAIYTLIKDADGLWALKPPVGDYIVLPGQPGGPSS